MCNRSVHYHSTAAVMAEALVARDVDKPEAARIAILVARADQMIDHCTPENLRTADGPGQVVTQIGVRSGKRMLYQDWWWAEFNQCHRWHFDAGNGWPCITVWDLCNRIVDPELLSGRDSWCMKLGAHTHTAQDTDGPHKGFVGYPAASNYERTAHVKGISWWSKAARWLLRRDRDEVIGHMLVPEIDCIEHCRDGAFASCERLWELVSGLSGTDMWNADNMPQSLVAIEYARNDADLEARQRRVFRFTVDVDLPDFAPFEGEELRAFQGVVR